MHVREADIGLNVLGRSVKAQASEEELDDGSTLGRDETGFSQMLTKDEYASFAQYMKSQHDMEVSEDDIPVQASQKKKRQPSSNPSAEENPDDVSLSLKWLSNRAQREMDDSLDDNPYADLMPSDLTPTRLVNRRRAKPLPTKLLHHNNIDWLKRFLTPTGQVMNRVQTRLGARDQRRVAKLIKRTRALGLLPYAGQVKVETHGWPHAPDILEDRPWEKELARRGLVIKRTREKAADTAE
jgi:ribosomal protein S18